MLIYPSSYNKPCGYLLKFNAFFLCKLHSKKRTCYTKKLYCVNYTQ